MASAQFRRLSKNVRPMNYALTLTPDLTSFTFSGQADIDIEIESPTNTIELNSAELVFNSAEYECNGATITTNKVILSEESELASLSFDTLLAPGKGCLRIAFTGCLNAKMKGFYRSKYVHPASGTDRFAAITQFESADARRAFPCWDDPVFKATFDVTIIAENDKTVLSNMPVIDTKPCGDHLLSYKFARTPVMSTYLVAFAIGEFDYIEAKDSNGVLIRVYTPLGKKEQGRFALEFATKTLPFYAKYFGIPYHLPKCDMIAVAELGFGAMENWGLVTYRENRLLIDATNSSIAAKEGVAMVVGHELAHQWFGNLVTMEWWTHLWLNEGFATWIEYLCVDHCIPEFDIWTAFVNNDYSCALSLDCLTNSHPIEVPVNSPAEVDEIFDTISYAKGGSVIRMLHNFIGDEAFRAGLNSYLEKYKFKNAVTEDLWQSLSESSGQNITDLMQLWTKQTGYPYINASTYINQKGEIVLRLSQKRFFADGSVPTEQEDFKWKVPISIVTKSSYPNVHKQILLEKTSDEVNLGVLVESDWVKLNKGTVGLYRTNYSPEMLIKLKEPVKEQHIHPTDRLGLENDLFALCQAGLVSAENVLQFVESFTGEENMIVWRDLINNLQNMSHMLLNTAYHYDFQSFMRRLLKPIGQKLGFTAVEGESGLTARCRALIFQNLAINGDAETIAEAQKQFSDHLAGKPIFADLRLPVYIAVLSVGDETTVAKFIDMYTTSDLQEEKMRLLFALGFVSKASLIEHVLKFSLSAALHAQESRCLIQSVSSNTTTKLSASLAWDLITNNWQRVQEVFTSGFTMPDLIQTVVSNVTTAQHADNVKAFFEQNPCPLAHRRIQQALESVNVKTKWLEREHDALKVYLQGTNKQ